MNTEPKVPYLFIPLRFPEFFAGNSKISEIEVRIKQISVDNSGKSIEKNYAKEAILMELTPEKIETLKKLFIPGQSTIPKQNPLVRC